MLNNNKSFLTIFINFVVLTDISKKPNNNFLEVSFILKKFWSVLNRFGYSGSKRLILQNLNKLVLDKRNINFEKKTQESFKFFRNEVYFDSGNNLFYLSNV